MAGEVPAVKDGREVMSKEDLDGVFGGNGGFEIGSGVAAAATVPVTPAAPATPAPAAPAAAAPAAPAAPAEPAAPVDPAAEGAAPAETVAPEGEAAPVEPAEPVAPTTPAAETPAEIEARVLRGVVKDLLAGRKPEAPAPAVVQDPPLIQQARRVAALTDEQMETAYDKLCDDAAKGLNPNGYKQAEALRMMRLNAPYHIAHYESMMEIREANEQTAAAAATRDAKAQLAALDRNPTTKGWQAHRKTMARLAAADEAAKAAGLEPAFTSVEDLYHAAKALDSRGKSPPLAPNTAAAKAAIVSGTPASRGGPAVPPAKPPAAKGDAFVDEVFAADKDVFTP